jgi:hypothetical protein
MQLTLENLGMLNYLREVFTRPAGRWDGFYSSVSPSMNFALRYQLAFGTYALAAMAQRTPAYRAPYAEAMRAAIERMLSVEAWGYWRAPEQAGAGALASSGHVAVLVSPHRAAATGPPSDPIAQDNLQYSGHLSVMLGLYEKLTGDSRYDSPFTLRDPHSGVEYNYTHGEVAERIHSQMQRNTFGGVCCEPGMAYVPCNNYALGSNTLHDALHGTSYARDNARWLKTVRARMVLKGPAVRGVFGTAYMKDFKLATPVAFNFTDAWGLAFLLPFDRPLVRRLYGRFKKRAIERVGESSARVGSSSMSERMEISDVGINTGFGAILAQGTGDTALSAAFHRYAEASLGPTWDGDRLSYAGAPRTLHTTALFALAATIEPGGADFARLFTAPPDRASLDGPQVASVDAPGGSAGVTRAELDPAARTLTVALRQVGSPTALRNARPLDARLTIVNAGAVTHVEVDKAPLPAERDEDGGLLVTLTVPPTGEVVCRVPAGRG